MLSMVSELYITIVNYQKVMWFYAGTYVTYVLKHLFIHFILFSEGSSESSGSENIPPVGVFWDIENCNVPSGRSAAVVVQRIRSRFFQGHREAEFICVCDISKESKSVIQELNNCQVSPRYLFSFHIKLCVSPCVHAGSEIQCKDFWMLNTLSNNLV